MLIVIIIGFIIHMIIAIMVGLLKLLSCLLLHMNIYIYDNYHYYFCYHHII